jgi:hypothetical protein
MSMKDDPFVLDTLGAMPLLNEGVVVEVYSIAIAIKKQSINPRLRPDMNATFGVTKHYLLFSLLLICLPTKYSLDTDEVGVPYNSIDSNTILGKEDDVDYSCTELADPKT